MPRQWLLLLLKALDTTKTDPEITIDNYGPDNGLDFAKPPKYLVVEGKLLNASQPTNWGGFGGVQIAVQGDGNSWSQTATSSGDWTAFEHVAADVVYLVFDLRENAALKACLAVPTSHQIQFSMTWGKNQFTGFVDNDTLNTGTDMKFYVLTDAIEKPAGASDFGNKANGFAVKK